MKVELPGGGAWGGVALGIGEGEPQLYECSLLDIMPGVLVVDVLGGGVVGEGLFADDAAWKLGVLSRWVCPNAMTLYF